MRRSSRGFLLVDLLTGLAILCGVVTVVLMAMGRAGEVVAVDAERAAAASGLGELLDGVRAGAIAVRAQGETRIGRAAGVTPLRGEECVVRTERWPDDPALTRVTATLRWTSASKRAASLSAQTLVRTSRLKIAGGAP